MGYFVRIIHVCHIYCIISLMVFDCFMVPLQIVFRTTGQIMYLASFRPALLPPAPAQGMLGFLFCLRPLGSPHHRGARGVFVITGEFRHADGTKMISEYSKKVQLYLF